MACELALVLAGRRDLLGRGHGDASAAGQRDAARSRARTPAARARPRRCAPRAPSRARHPQRAISSTARATPTSRAHAQRLGVDDGARAHQPPRERERVRGTAGTRGRPGTRTGEPTATNPTATSDGEGHGPEGRGGAPSAPSPRRRRPPSSSLVTPSMVPLRHGGHGLTPRGGQRLLSRRVRADRVLVLPRRVSA